MGRRNWTSRRAFLFSQTGKNFGFQSVGLGGKKYPVLTGAVGRRDSAMANVSYASGAIA